MQVERLCRKFERILDDNAHFTQDCEDHCLEDCQGKCLSQDGRSWIQSMVSKTPNFFKNPIFLGLLIGGIIALILLFVNRSIYQR